MFSLQLKAFHADSKSYPLKYEQQQHRIGKSLEHRARVVSREGISWR